MDVYLRTATLWPRGDGDVNADGHLDAADLVRLVNHLDGTATLTHPVTISNADLASPEGALDGHDLDALAALLVGSDY
jgi:hypothetical protein